jgi:hypothetical protein
MIRFTQGFVTLISTVFGPGFNALATSTRYAVF